MQQQSATFTWTSPREHAAALVAEDELTDEEIAEKLAIHRVTLARWKTHPDFRSRVDELIAEFALRTMRYAIARLDRRVAAQSDRWQRMKRLIDARASAHAAVPGGETGLIARELRLVRQQGRDAQVVEEYAFDAALMREMRELERQVAQELGQWVERRAMEVSGELRHGEVDDEHAQYVADLIARGALSLENGTTPSG